MAVQQAGSRYGFETTTGLVIQQGLFQESEELKHAIGTRVQLADGRVFFYAKAGAVALAAGLLNMQATPISGHEDCDVAAAVAVLDKQITLTPATAPVTANQYAEGFVSMRSASGVGQNRKVRGHPAALTAANVVIDTYDPFTAAITTSGQADLIKNPYDEVIESATEENLPSGVPLIAITAGWYFWNQTFGNANVLSDGAIAAGSNVGPGTVAGSVAVKSVETMPDVGTMALLSANTEYAQVFLKLAA